MLCTISFGRIPYPVSDTSIRTTIHSIGGADFWFITLCWFRWFFDSWWWKSAPAFPFVCAVSRLGRCPAPAFAPPPRKFALRRQAIYADDGFRITLPDSDSDSELGGSLSLCDVW